MTANPRAWVWCTQVLVLLLASMAARAAGTLVDLGEVASRHVAPRKVVVWLPPGYAAQPERRHAVLYMHDGQNLFDPATAYGGEAWGVDEALARLIDEGRVRSTLVVGVWNTRQRFQEYLPAAVAAELPPALGERLRQRRGAPALSDAYLRFLVEELKPVIDRRFRTAVGRNDTFVMGSSMGGLISTYALARYPGVFGGAAALSSHWPLFVDAADYPPNAEDAAAIATAFAEYLRRSLPEPGRHRLYFDHGSQRLDAAYAPYQARVDQVLAERGYVVGRDRLSRTFPGATHNEAAWRARVAIPLEFLLAPTPPDDQSRGRPRP